MYIEEKAMKQKVLHLVIFLSLLLFLSSCTTGGSFLSLNATNIELSESNFNIVARNVQGHSEASYLLGFSFSSGSIANTMALARLSGSTKLYDDAIKNLWENYTSVNGDFEGKNLVLANIRIDSDILNLILYTETNLYVTADVIEFK
jgi:hypothetical protein